MAAMCLRPVTCAMRAMCVEWLGVDMGAGGATTNGAPGSDQLPLSWRLGARDGAGGQPSLSTPRARRGCSREIVICVKLID